MTTSSSKVSSITTFCNLKKTDDKKSKNEMPSLTPTNNNKIKIEKKTDIYQDVVNKLPLKIDIKKALQRKTILDERKWHSVEVKFF